jgi:hypothetical protein
MCPVYAYGGEYEANMDMYAIILGCLNQDAEYIFLLGILDLIQNAATLDASYSLGLGMAKISHPFASLGPLLHFL